MTNQIIPPLQLVDQWVDMLLTRSDHDVFTKAAQWGADHELDACCEWLCTVERWKTVAEGLRAARRPKPMSLKEQALAELVDAYDEDKIDDTAFDTIHRALKQLE
jgi:hypothetical protein